MGNDPDRHRSSNSGKEQAVRPGTPLHRLLERIAREIAKDMEDDRTEESGVVPKG
jgi:hypothetical protein